MSNITATAIQYPGTISENPILSKSDFFKMLQFLANAGTAASGVVVPMHAVLNPVSASDPAERYKLSQYGVGKLVEPSIIQKNNLTQEQQQEYLTSMHQVIPSFMPQAIQKNSTNLSRTFGDNMSNMFANIDALMNQRTMNNSESSTSSYSSTSDRVSYNNNENDPKKPSPWKKWAKILGLEQGTLSGIDLIGNGMSDSGSSLKWFLTKFATPAGWLYWIGKGIGSLYSDNNPSNESESVQNNNTPEPVNGSEQNYNNNMNSIYSSENNEVIE